MKNHEAILLLVNEEIERLWRVVAKRGNNGSQHCWCCGENVGAYQGTHKDDCEAARAEKMIAKLEGK